MFIIMKPWKILQRHTYDLLSHKYALVIIVLAFTTILVSAIQFGEVLVSWSHDKYESVFTSLFSDNLARRSFRSMLCQNVPIDVVYTWVNGSDPELRDDLETLRVRLARETSERCPYAHCVPSAWGAYRGWLDDVAVSPLSHVASSTRNWTLLGFPTGRAATLACSGPLLAGGHNVTLSHAHFTTDPTAPEAIALPSTLLLVGAAWSGGGREAEAFPSLRAGVESHADRGVVVITLKDEAVARHILQNVRNVTLSGSRYAVRSAFLIPELPSPSHPRDFSASRFEDKDELRYSLRSLEKFAPWVRHVYLVTNGQLPHWLDLENPRLTVVTHRQIFPDSTHLPTFSSPAIESHLHRIPGLSTLFLYLNDDVMFGRDVWPEDFITPANGQKVYLSWGVPDCSPACPWSWVGDGACDPQCNNSVCFFDNGDCRPDALLSEEEEQNYQQMAHMVGEDLSPHDDQRNLVAELQNSEAERNIDDIFNDRRKRDTDFGPDKKNQRDIQGGMSANVQRPRENTKEVEPLGFERFTNKSERDGRNQRARDDPLPYDEVHKTTSIITAATHANATRQTRRNRDATAMRRTRDILQIVGPNASQGRMKDVLRRLYVGQRSSRVGRFNRTRESRYRLRGRYGGSTNHSAAYSKVGNATRWGTQNSTEHSWRQASVRPENVTAHGKRRPKHWLHAGAERSMERPGQMDTFAESLLYVNQLLNRAYGFAPRKVPAHMPHLVDRGVMGRLQDKFAEEWLTTSSHRVRSSRDMQFAFSYFYFLMSEKVNVSTAEIFRTFDTDRSGTWSDRELRTLLTRLFEVPLSYHRVLYVEQLLTNCSQHFPPETLTTPPYERYQDSKLPIISQRLVTSCRPMAKLLSDKFGQRNRYKFEVVKDRTQDVSFKMLSSNLSHLVQHLDDVRRQPKKFICLNDNLDPSRESDNAVARAVLQDFYESLFPLASTFELPPDLRNRFLHVRDLERWRDNRARLRSAIYVCLLGLAAFTAVNLFSTEVSLLLLLLCPR